VNTIIWLWYCRIKLIFFPLICLILAVFAVAVVLGEVAVFSSWFDMLNVFRLVNLLDNFVAIDVIAYFNSDLYTYPAVLHIILCVL
jgi:hypothetical protein